MSWEYSLAGLLVGGFVGLTGMGGGSLVAPLLIVVFGVPALPAVGSGLLFAAVTQLVGGLQHARLRSVDVSTAALLALGSVPASIAGAWLFAGWMGRSAAIEQRLTDVLGVVLLLVAVSLLLRGRLGAGGGDSAPRGPRPWLLTVGGVVVGAMTGITSVGSGSLTTALLSATTRERGQRVVGTVVLHAMLLTFAAGMTHLALGEVNLAMTAALLMGSVPGVVVGSQLTAYIPEARMRSTLAVALLVLSLVMLLPSAAALDSALAASADRQGTGAAPAARTP